MDTVQTQNHLQVCQPTATGSKHSSRSPSPSPSNSEYFLSCFETLKIREIVGRVHQKVYIHKKEMTRISYEFISKQFSTIVMYFAVERYKLGVYT